MHSLSTNLDFIEDERVFCHQCANAEMVEQRQSMPSEQMERPTDVKHRCHMFQTKASAVESEEWWLT
jgi:hypothetical protein